MDFVSQNGDSDCPIYRIKEYGIVCSYTKSIGGCLCTPTLWISVDNRIWRNQLVIAKVVDGGDCTTVGLSHDIVMHQRADNDKSNVLSLP